MILESCYLSHDACGFDCFHVGHVAFLERARALGDCLLVGLHTDSILRAAHGPGHPIMSLHERALCVMANKYVDDTIIGVPWTVTKDLIASMHISVVVCGSAPTTVKQRSLLQTQLNKTKKEGAAKKAHKDCVSSCTQFRNMPPIRFVDQELVSF